MIVSGCSRDPAVLIHRHAYPFPPPLLWQSHLFSLGYNLIELIVIYLGNILNYIVFCCMVSSVDLEDAAEKKGLK